MIGYFTDNNVSQGVMRAFSHSIKTAHINTFKFNKETESVFYGILRGSGSAMRYQQMRGINYWYVDNGYTDAIYIDSSGMKEMNGKYRIVRNDLIESCDVDPVRTTVGNPRVLFLPPTAYTAFMHDTTPEDWIIRWAKLAKSVGMKYGIRNKDTDIPLETMLKDFDAVFAFNSMGVVRAAEMGKAIFTTNGIVRNSYLFGQSVPYYDSVEIMEYYQGKQFTLEEIKDRGIKCLQ